jgi:hypothetical protein
MATGSEMAMAAVFKWLGVDPAETKKQMADVFHAVLDGQARLQRIEEKLDALAISKQEIETHDRHDESGPTINGTGTA